MLLLQVALVLLHVYRGFPEAAILEGKICAKYEIIVAMV